jgi:hypothetical protein
MATALAELGATGTSIDAETRDRLDRDGYAPLPGVLCAAQLTAIRTRLAELLAAEGDQAGIEVHQEAGTDRLADLINKGAMFDPCFTDPRMLACIAHVLGDFKLSSWSSTATYGTVAPRTAATGPAVRCTPTSAAAAEGSNSTRRNTPSRRPWPA